MFLFYLGYIGLWAAVEDPDKAADLTSVLALVGVVFALMSRYAVEFFTTLHQESSLSLDEDENMTDAFYEPLLFAIAGFALLFVALLLVRTRTEIRKRRARSLRMRAAEAA